MIHIQRTMEKGIAEKSMLWLRQQVTKEDWAVLTELTKSNEINNKPQHQL